MEYSSAESFILSLEIDGGGGNVNKCPKTPKQPSVYILNVQMMKNDTDTLDNCPLLWLS
jgi:hypothetical protein